MLRLCEVVKKMLMSIAVVGTTGKRKRDSDESAPDTGEGGLEGLLGDYGSGED